MKFLYVLLFMFSFGAFAQLETSKLTHNFGDLYQNAPSYYDFTFKNTSGLPVYLLTVNKPREVNYIHTKKIIQPDSTMKLRLKINDQLRGKFNYTVDVYFSNTNQPFKIKLTGNVKQKSTNQLAACPDFNAPRPTNGLAQFEITIKVIDKETGAPIKKSKVILLNGNEIVDVCYTNSGGIIHKSIPLGYYYMTAQKKNYHNNNFEGYVNYQNNYIEIELDKPIQAPKPPIENKPVLIVNKPIENVEIADSVPTHTEPIEIEIPDVVEVPNVDTITQTEIDNLPEDNFDDNYFLPNNIVFIVDVSTSMKYKEKLELMKKSMIELTKVLRPQDHVSLIAYSSTYKILFEDVSGKNKQQIIDKVNSVTVGGSTNGGEAIEAAYDLVNKSYIENGNNLIFMVTDGAFNKGQNKYKRTIKRNYKNKNIKFTMVGIKTGKYLTYSMTEMATFGGGKYIKIMTEDDANDKLFKEIKRTSAVVFKTY